MQLRIVYKHVPDRDSPVAEEILRMSYQLASLRCHCAILMHEKNFVLSRSKNNSKGRKAPQGVYLGAGFPFYRFIIS